MKVTEEIRYGGRKNSTGTDERAKDKSRGLKISKES